MDGGYVPAGPSGSPTRGLVNVLPTGRNFYSVDPKAIPSRNAWDTGVALADSLLARHRADTGEWPALVGLTVWGTSAMRTQGDDLAEVPHTERPTDRGYSPVSARYRSTSDSAIAWPVSHASRDGTARGSTE